MWRSVCHRVKSKVDPIGGPWFLRAMAWPRFSRARCGTPGIWARNVVEAYAGIGWVHGAYRPLQTLLLGTIARGALARHLIPRADLVELDTLVTRFNLPERGASALRALDAASAECLHAYVRGVNQGLKRAGRPVELRALLTRLPPLTESSVLAGLMVSAYLGLAQVQERMEGTWARLLAAGADPEVFLRMFGDRLEGWEPERLRSLGRRTGLRATGGAILGVGGSNAWAMTGARTASGMPMLCGDPHLQINQLPSLFVELRVRMGDDFWLGATIPGLPGLAVGRNRYVAWSGTFAVADNIDFLIPASEEMQKATMRSARVRRRFRRSLQRRFCDGTAGTWDGTDTSEVPLAVRWAALDKPHETLCAYLRLPQARSAAEAENILRGAHTLSLHFVLADRDDDVRYVQVGRIPRRRADWSGLYPTDCLDDPWTGYYEGGALPRAPAEQGICVSANEERPAPDGGRLSTLAQPPYRWRRIRKVLEASTSHDRGCMAQLQHDVHSPQAERLLPRFLQMIPDGPLRQQLEAWDHSYDAESVGAHAFECTYRHAVEALAPVLGGAEFVDLFRHTELRVWWADALDRLLDDEVTWRGDGGALLHRALQSHVPRDLRPWGEVQTFVMSNMILGGLPRWMGLDRGPFPLVGSLATICQGNVLNVDGKSVAVGPAYRMICDLAEDCIWTSLPGGIGGGPWQSSYDCWVDDWRDGAYHALRAPGDDEHWEENL